MMQTMHSSSWGSKLANICSHLLLSADVDEDELVGVVSKRMPFPDDAAVDVLRHSICDRVGQPCHDRSL